MSAKSIILVTALAIALPAAAGAFSLRCDDPISSLSARDLPDYRRSGLPDWVRELRQQRQERRNARTRPGMMSPIRRPDRLEPRRAGFGRPPRPELPAWVKARRQIGPQPSDSPLRQRPSPAVASDVARGRLPYAVTRPWHPPIRHRPARSIPGYGRRHP